MTTAVTFIFSSKHTPTRNQNGGIACIPAIPATPALYVIRNKDQPAHVYAGTSSNAKQRFSGRLEVYRESGLPDAVLARVRFYLIKVKIDDQSKAVNDVGTINTAGGLIDVESLFIRSIVARAHCNVYNIAKWQGFQNPFNERLDVEFEGFPNSTGYFIPANFHVNKNLAF